MTKLHDLYRLGGQSPWLDNLKRSYLTSGRLAELVSSGVRGLTSNPTIMAKAIAVGQDYDKEFSDALAGGQSVEDAYWDLVITDVKGALGVLRPVFDESNGGDGFVSIEVAPGLAHETDATIKAARDLHNRIAEANLLVKIPATSEGLPAIETMIGEGRSINVTLIFSLERYREVVEAYLKGLEKFVAVGGDASKVASVASLFVSRVDTEVDRRLEAMAKDNPGSKSANRALELRGTAAVAQARLAYKAFLELFSGLCWMPSKRRGARRQRPLWASTSTKNPAYGDLVYVDSLVVLRHRQYHARGDRRPLPRPWDRGSDYRGRPRCSRDKLRRPRRMRHRLRAGLPGARDRGCGRIRRLFDDLIGKLKEKADALKNTR